MKASGDNQGLEPGLARALEVALASGVALSGALLLAGLATDRAGLLRAGLLLLLFTPVARVIVLTVGLFHQKDWGFAFVSLWILLVLLSSISLGSLLG
ncbi:MAG: DUF1634 domain-containing protein [Vicinamibacteria bacterium]|nr:DUF1634 domain-containing protein [Vicinamibacteria bacterium]